MSENLPAGKLDNHPWNQRVAAQYRTDLFDALTELKDLEMDDPQEDEEPQDDVSSFYDLVSNRDIDGQYEDSLEAANDRPKPREPKARKRTYSTKEAELPEWMTDQTKLPKEPPCRNS